MNKKWDAQGYTNKFSFVHSYGEDLFNLIDWKENSKVVDLGCGNGALTSQINGMEEVKEVIGIDASSELLKVAKEKYPNIDFINADITDFTMNKKVDIVFSNAVFHWIDESKQLKMLENVYNILEDNGQFIFEFGGYGNNKLIHKALNESFTKRNLKYTMPFYFPTIGEYSCLLEKAGFEVRYANLFDRMTPLNGDDGMKQWIEMFITEPFIRINADTKNEIINEAVDELKESLFSDKWYADYVRIRFRAVK